MFGPNRHNQKGMFENVEIRQNIVKPYFRKIGVDPLGQNPLPNNRQVFEVSQPQVDSFRNQIEKVMVKEGYKTGPWFYKGAKSCLVWYIWAQAFPTAKWVIVRRKSEDIADSCLRTSFMKAYKNQAGWISWVEKHERRFDEMRTAGLDVIEFWPSKVIEGDWHYAEKFVTGLGLEYKDNLIKSFIDPTLYRRS